MRTPHAHERPRRKRAASLTRQPSRYQQWRAGAWCVVLRGRKRRRYHRRDTYAVENWGGGIIHIHELNYTDQVRMGQS